MLSVDYSFYQPVTLGDVATDTITGGGGADLEGGDGNDFFTVDSPGPETVYGGACTDTLLPAAGSYRDHDDNR